MKITAIELKNIRGFKKLERTEFSNGVNVLIGTNNSGKSTIINSIFTLQRDSILTGTDITIGETDGEIKLYIEGDYLWHGSLEKNSSFTFKPNSVERKLFDAYSNHIASPNCFPEVEPDNLIYPYLSKRKSVGFNEVINEQSTNVVLGNFQNLFLKIDRLITPEFQPGNSHYIKACKDILGFTISTLSSTGGKKGVYFIHNQEHIPLTAMGEGVTNIVGLITDLCVAENKVFLIEEPENDIHPTALKSLLNFILEKSKTNQFFISTHSNIVLKYLGSDENTKIFHVNSELIDIERPKLFISTLREIQTTEERRDVLESLGYEFNDFGLWSAWLFLEESSAEFLIREYFLKWYTPSLVRKLKTFSTKGIGNMNKRIDDFCRLFTFLHLEPIYKNKAWIVIDAGDDEKKILEEIKSTYIKSGWNESSFSQFSEHDFEKYYPERFEKQVDLIGIEQDTQKKRKMKNTLLEEVKEWILQDEERAKNEFILSAGEVIKKLTEIESNI